MSKRPQDLKDLCTAFEMPPCTWLHQYQKATGFFLAQEGEQAGERTTYSTACRFLLKHVIRNQSQSSSVNLTAFHIGGERDSAIAAQMAQSMKQDSAAMNAISVLGLVFLPGTFVSAIFSMSFFHYSASSPSSAETWTVSANFWVYWATTIPLTMLTVLIWYLWHRRTLHDHSYGA
ncbi:hypothetical protein B0A54_05039 [Friedmanniomyces endolithicus]|uniref:Uncharacterized protein n=1 Tax=Friedmanniomyces endolithicus TaxID=329885 RepID=A0A4U0V8L0_9PEZI|nr:hypothetical protein B0A54_05039 [Friedmanniomyces endolithicus]